MKWPKRVGDIKATFDLISKIILVTRRVTKINLRSNTICIHNRSVAGKIMLFIVAELGTYLTTCLHFKRLNLAVEPSKQEVQSEFELIQSRGKKFSDFIL